MEIVMASCPKCGKRKIKKRKDGRRKCPRDGFLNSGMQLNRAGEKVTK